MGGSIEIGRSFPRKCGSIIPPDGCNLNGLPSPRTGFVAIVSIAEAIIEIQIRDGFLALMHLNRKSIKEELWTFWPLMFSEYLDIFMVLLKGMTCLPCRPKSATNHLGKDIPPMRELGLHNNIVVTIQESARISRLFTT
jgi:hypothetical protein